MRDNPLLLRACLVRCHVDCRFLGKWEEVERCLANITMREKICDLYIVVSSVSLCKDEAHFSLSPIRWVGNKTFLKILRFSGPYEFPQFFY